MGTLINYQRPFVTLSDLVDEFFGEGDLYETGSKNGKSIHQMLVDIIEEENKYTVYAEMPGVAKNDIQITIEKGVLTIKGERKEEKREHKKGKYQYYERSHGSFQRSFALPEHIDENSIEAHFNNGLLELSLKKKEKEKPKTIEVKIV